jgi:hypothetical protein
MHTHRTRRAMSVERAIQLERKATDRGGRNGEVLPP